MTPSPRAAPGYAWHAMAATAAAEVLATSLDAGLTAGEAAGRRLRVGANRIAEHGETPVWRLLLAQFRSLVVLLLLAAAIAAAALGERTEALAILAALGLNAGIGFTSEWRARRSLARLRALAVPVATVWRDGRARQLPAADLVPGDLIGLEAGASVPADARLVRATGLAVTEAALTGESVPAAKEADAVLGDAAPLAERRTMVYLGTSVVAGSGRALVTATGVATELGRIGQLVALAGERTTPLERQVEQLGRRLMVLALAICGVVGVAGILHGEPVGLMIETAISLAVAAIPEGLPAVTAVALAAGLWRLARAGALVRRLPSVETLGACTVLCADKTGTMTRNQMTVTGLWLDGRRLEVGGDGRSATGAITDDGRPVAAATDAGLRRLLTVAALANDARLEPGPDGLEGAGDPTEVALLVAAVKAGLPPERLAEEWPRRAETPFDPARRLMTSTNEGPGGALWQLVKGAPAAVLARCDAEGDDERLLDAAARERILAANRAMAADGLRVLAFAWRVLPAAGAPDAEEPRALRFAGLAGLSDPIRPGVREAIAHAAAAGIRTVMITGDQRVTAEAVGRALGLPPDAIRSRVSPEGKVALVEALQAQGETVAMTGDGVNDAPALARADIGVAMGRHGTDVARETADLVLTDDDFTTLVRAVEEGRVIHANLRKVIHFLFSCNLSEILLIFAAILLGFPPPLTPLQILWVNLVTDALPALALVRDPAEPDIMRRPPRDPREGLVRWRSGARILAEGAVLGGAVLAAFVWTAWAAADTARAGSVAFTALVMLHPVQAIGCRSERVPWWRLPPNVLSWVAMASLAVAQGAALGWAPLARLLGVAPLGAGDWLVVAAAVLVPAGLLQALKTRGPRAPAGPARPGVAGAPPGVGPATPRDR